MASVKPISNEIYEDLKAIEEDEAFKEARAIYKALEKNPYLGEPLHDRPELGIYLQDCYKVYFYSELPSTYRGGGFFLTSNFQ